MIRIHPPPPNVILINKKIQLRISVPLPVKHPHVLPRNRSFMLIAKFVMLCIYSHHIPCAHTFHLALSVALSGVADLEIPQAFSPPGLGNLKASPVWRRIEERKRLWWRL